jgi:hypothetical protein
MGKRYTNTAARLITIAFVKFLPGATETVPSDATIASWNAAWKPSDPKASATVQDAERKASLAAQEGALITSLEKAPVFLAGLLKPGTVAMPAPDRVTLSSLIDLDLGKASAQVRLCTDLETLAGWVTSETRQVILDLIKARGEALTKA